jgi:hypothetical protein
MVALRTGCKHPDTGVEYVKTSVGGVNNSPENFAVCPCRTLRPSSWATDTLQNGFTHAFISQFDNEEDRAYYLVSKNRRLLASARIHANKRHLLGEGPGASGFCQEHR